MDGETFRHFAWVVWIQHPDSRASLQVLPRIKEWADDPVGGGWKGEGKGQGALQDLGFFAHERHSQAIFGFLGNNDAVGRIPEVAEEVAASEVSEWEL